MQFKSLDQFCMCITYYLLQQIEVNKAMFSAPSILKGIAFGQSQHLAQLNHVPAPSDNKQWNDSSCSQQSSLMSFLYFGKTSNVDQMELKICQAELLKNEFSSSMNSSHSRSSFARKIKKNEQQFKLISKQMMEENKRVLKMLNEVWVQNIIYPVRSSFSKSFLFEVDTNESAGNVLKQLTLTEQLEIVQNDYQKLKVEYKKLKSLVDIEVQSIEPRASNFIDTIQDEMEIEQFCDERTSRLIAQNKKLKEQVSLYKQLMLSKKL